MGFGRKRVEDITRDFLQQTHEVRDIKVKGFENGIWFVEGKAHSSSGEHVKKLRIDGKTGNIISVEESY